DYNNIHIGYLMGVLAARMSKSGKIGVVSGLEGLPNVVQYVGGFRLGAKATKPDVEVKVIYIKDMEDAALSKEAALSLSSAGADLKYSDSQAFGAAVPAAIAAEIEAVKKKFTNGELKVTVTKEDARGGV